MVVVALVIIFPKAVLPDKGGAFPSSILDKRGQNLKRGRPIRGRTTQILLGAAMDDLSQYPFAHTRLYQEHSILHLLGDAKQAPRIPGPNSCIPAPTSELSNGRSYRYKEKRLHQIFTHLQLIVLISHSSLDGLGCLASLGCDSLLSLLRSALNRLSGSRSLLCH